ncbi:MAG: gliding motility protein GldM [Bacteroidales bacterium]|jgi:gliding motility-associated protein GldM|nr:gliding motility protein GldM [Bacteroidales bacterium]MDI9575343.1 gliding motility protein GldM [Bacteroidota bacterium]MDD2594184.1 gliding motility protein GldM [Bacteroidales bacterium]MDD3756222.1 gliding motility protein GldM [Bacteroidales bacterium]MDY0401434.1 gliding motility protein GldM [Bacteroidales bacterium]
MGAKNCAETPRQKMIGMMYLVLTAMLALNVSKDILDAFIIVNDSIEETNRIFYDKVQGNYAMFDKAYAMTPEKVKDNYEKALIVKKEADELVKYIEDLKAQVIAVTERVSVEEARKLNLRDIKGRDNFDAPTNFFVGSSQDGSAGKARELKNKLVGFRKQMIELLGKYADKVQLGLDIENKMYPTIEGDQQLNWEMTNFYHTILAADIVILNKLILEVRNMEADVVAQLYSAVSAEDFTFDRVGVKVVPKSSIVVAGSQYEAEIFVAAYDTRQNPEILIGDDVDTVNLKVLGNVTKLEGDSGRGILRIPATSPGAKKFGGTITIKSQSGAVQTYWFKEEYFVMSPTATVSADKMNVFYIGVDNPVSISVPGVPNDRVRASITNGTIIPKGNGKYIVRVSQGTKSVVNVTAEMNGKMMSMGSAEFRVKRVPSPIAKVAGKAGGNYTKTELLANPYVIADIENFEFDLKFDIVSYSFTYRTPAGDLLDKQVSGMRFTQDVIDIIQRSTRGSRFYIENIKAKGPDGTVRELPTVSMRITG